MLGLLFFFCELYKVYYGMINYFFIKEETKMILFAILVLTLALLAVITVVVVSATGAVGIVLFGDVIVCIWLIVWFIKKLLRKRKK